MLRVFRVVLCLSTLLILLPESSALALTSTWDNGAPGGNANRWGTTGNRNRNWTGNSTPQSAGDIAIFAGAGNSGITFESNLSVGEVRFDSGLGYVIDGGSTLSLDATSGSAAVNVLSTNTASQELGMAISLADDLAIDHAGAGTLTLSGPISGVGRSLTVSGVGDVVLSSTGNSYSGATTVTSGQLSSGADNVIPDASALTINGGTFNLGTHTETVGALTINGGGLSGTGQLSASSLSLAGATSDIDATLTLTDAGTPLELGNSASDVHIFRGPVNHGGSTFVRNGRVELRGNGAIRQSSRIEVASGAVLDASNSTTGRIELEAGQTLAGTGQVEGELVVGNGATLSPGNSPGILNTGDLTWEDGGSLLLEMDDADGTEGVNWDLVNVTGILSITATGADPFTVDLVSLLPGLNTPGDAADFPGLASWTIVRTTGGISGFTSAGVVLDTSGFTNTHTPGAFSLGVVGGDELVLSYAVPEPGSSLLSLVGLLGLAYFGRRKASS